MQTSLANGQTLKEMFAAGTAWLEKNVSVINAINVFPVPDGDTGTNMLLTMHSAIEEANQNTDSSASSIAKSIAHGALMGARGNSGVILSQFWRGIAKGLDGKNSFNGRDFALALTEASQIAYEGIVHPVEGTMLTVLRDAARAAEETTKTNFESLLSAMESATNEAKDSVARTPDLLPVLQEAGVVDAGGQGLYILLDGALHFLKKKTDELQCQEPELIAISPSLTPKLTPTTEIETPYGYCIEFLLEGQKLNADNVGKKLRRKGQSVIVAGGSSMLKIHIHSLNPGEVLDYATHLGTLHQIKIDNMDDEYAEFIKAQKKRTPKIGTAIVVVTSGDGLFEVFNSLGATIIVLGGQTMNPSVRELLQAVESAPSDNVILLPNNKNIILTASQVESLSPKKVKVIHTKTVPQGIAALLAFNYEMNLEENSQNMEQAISSVQTIEITRAVRGTQINGQKIKEGQFIAILNDENLIVSSNDTNDISDIIFESLTKADIEKTEMITIYYGAEAQSAEAENIARKIRNKYQTEVEVIRGNQPHYNYIISLE
ncbi:MAG: DAK2 domain-containing protein [Dehalococcoidia bacterium]|nr:DAK2 domain-containing protein [Dehalococcoidia bacterium]